MGLQIHTGRDVLLFVVSISLVSTLMSETAVFLLYTIAGRSAFHLENAILFAGLVPVLISVPITYVVARMSQRLTLAQSELRALADTDPLTQLSNRRSFFKAAEQTLDEQKARGKHTTLLVIDADHFKELNDSFGHAVGDKALVVIADVLRESFRETDLTCRVGGEEFAVLLPGMTMTDAHDLAERVVDRVADSPLFESNTVIEFSVSCGIADTTTSFDLAALFKAADDAMYVAKSKGRNQVSLVSNRAA